MADRVIRTVLGDIAPDSAGVTMCHEHLFIDQRQVSFQAPLDPAEADLASERVTMELLGWVRWNWTSSIDNLVLDSEPDAIDEAARYAAAGGRTLVDCTLPGIGRDPDALVRVAEATDLHIVMGAGFYVGSTHPPEVSDMSVDDIASLIVREFTSGVGSTGIRAGIIGEIGLSWPATAAEEKVLRGAAAAQADLGCGLSVHPGKNLGSVWQALDILEAQGADLSRVIFCHVERTAWDLDALAAIARTGCFVELDLFGTTTSAPQPYQLLGIDLPSDADRLRMIEDLLEEGHGRQVLVSQDVCTKHRTRRYGGLGYDHILRNIAPWMRRRGLTQEVVDMILIDNPRAALSFEPR